MKDRIKKMRHALKLTQQEFAQRIGSVQNTITGYETGRRVPSNQVVNLICREFGVNEKWLRTGVGEMFIPQEKSSLQEFAAKHGLNDVELEIIKTYLQIPKEIRQPAIEYFRINFLKE